MASLWPRHVGDHGLVGSADHHGSHQRFPDRLRGLGRQQAFCGTTSYGVPVVKARRSNSVGLPYAPIQHDPEQPGEGGRLIREVYLEALLASLVDRGFMTGDLEAGYPGGMRSGQRQHSA